MTTRKRGLGRGLEALLVDVAEPEKPVANENLMIAQTLIDALQQENRRLQLEAQNLHTLLIEFESIVQQFGANS